MAKLWAGRFSKTTDEKVNEFNASILFDQRLYKQDIAQSLAHSAMLEKQGILTSEDKEAIHTGLQQIEKEIAAGDIVFTTEYEDIHMAVEQILTERIGDAGKRLHTGRSRNDQVATDMKLYVREEMEQIRDQILHLISVFTELAKANLDTVMPGYTHLQRAQPISLAHHAMAYANMLARDVKRIENTLSLMNTCPLGSGALASTTYPLDRFQTAETLGFDAPCANSLDGVSDRDYIIEALSDLSVLMMHLSRYSEELIAWCSWEFHFVELDDAYATGSSIMPQKKNPDICELIRGKTGRVYGDLMAFLTTMKATPLAYNKDMQEDKEAFFDAADTAAICLDVLADMIATMRVLPENMARAARGGFINATDAADYLTKKGLPFRDAYKITGGLVKYCIDNGTDLEHLSLDELHAFSDLFDEDYYNAVSLQTALAGRKVYGGPAPEAVKTQIELMEGFLKEHA